MTVESNDSSQNSFTTLRLGEILLQRQRVTEAEIERALTLQQSIGGRIGSLLMRIGALSEENLLEALALQLQMPLLNSSDLPDDYESLLQTLEQSGIMLDWWLDQEALIWLTESQTLRCSAKEILDTTLHEVVERIAREQFNQARIEWCLLRSHELEYLLNRLARLAEDGDALGGSSLRELAEEAPVIEFVNNLMAQAVDQRASDIHIEPEKLQVQIRFRVDGVLYRRLTLPPERFRAIASRIKLVSGMDIAEQRLPQDGRLETRVGGEEIDIRVSALPGVYGESLVLRLLPKEKQRFSLDTLGLSAEGVSHLSQLAHEPHGIVLVTGPTGSGKSTTLYSLLEATNRGDRKIITVEDPVEYRLPGITQIQTQEEIGLSFAATLRSILRQDPDVVMIGEIRDRETAEIAIQASLTGHLVLSTLHTNDAVSAFTRLIDMG